DMAPHAAHCGERGRVRPGLVDGGTRPLAEPASMNDYNTIERIAQALVDLTERLAKQGYETSAGLLGGEFGYGAFYEDDTFHMRPYCWCGKDDCMWCVGCLCARPGDDDCEYC